SITSVSPVIKEDSSDARNKTACAISSGWPMRRNAFAVDNTGHFFVFFQSSTIFVSITPGAIALTRMFFFPNSVAAVFVSAITLLFDAEYAATSFCPLIPAILAVLIMELPEFIYGIAIFIPRNI